MSKDRDITSKEGDKINIANIPPDMISEIIRKMENISDRLRFLSTSKNIREIAQYAKTKVILEEMPIMNIIDNSNTASIAYEIYDYHLRVYSDTWEIFSIEIDKFIFDNDLYKFAYFWDIQKAILITPYYVIIFRDDFRDDFRDEVENGKFKFYPKDEIIKMVYMDYRFHPFIKTNKNMYLFRQRDKIEYTQLIEEFRVNNIHIYKFNSYKPDIFDHCLFYIDDKNIIYLGAKHDGLSVSINLVLLTDNNNKFINSCFDKDFLEKNYDQLIELIQDHIKK